MSKKKRKKKNGGKKLSETQLRKIVLITAAFNLLTSIFTFTVALITLIEVIK